VPARVFPAAQEVFLLALDFFGGVFLLALDFFGGVFLLALDFFGGVFPHLDIVIPIHFDGTRHRKPGQPHLVVLLQAIYLG
jgi:hypothetical protein